MTGLADEAQRLSLASALTRHARERVGDAAADSDVEALLVGARLLGAGATAFEQRHHVRFDPPYPGAVAGPQPDGARARVLFACTAYGPDGRAVGTVFTALIAGRRPGVSVAPPGARLH